MIPAPKEQNQISIHRVVTRGKEYVYAWRGGPSLDPAGDVAAQQRDAIERLKASPPIIRKRKRASVSAGIQDALRIAVKGALDNAKARSVKKSRHMELDRAMVEAMLAKQNWRCAISGLPFDMSFDAERKFSYNPYGISIDRIDNAGGYTRSNVRLVLTALNFAMNEWGADIYLHIARQAVARDMIANATQPHFEAPEP